MAHQRSEHHKTPFADMPEDSEEFRDRVGLRRASVPL